MSIYCLRPSLEKLRFAATWSSLKSLRVFEGGMAWAGDGEEGDGRNTSKFALLDCMS